MLNKCHKGKTNYCSLKSPISILSQVNLYQMSYKHAVNKWFHGNVISHNCCQEEINTLGNRALVLFLFSFWLLRRISNQPLEKAFASEERLLLWRKLKTSALFLLPCFAGTHSSQFIFNEGRIVYYKRRHFQRVLKESIIFLSWRSEN